MTGQRNRGRMMRRTIWDVVAPSTRAARSRSCGMDSMAAVKIIRPEDIDPRVEQHRRYQGVLPECKKIRQSHKVPVETVIQARQPDEASDANRHNKKYDDQ